MEDTSFHLTKPVAPNSLDLNPVDKRIWTGFIVLNMSDF